MSTCRSPVRPLPPSSKSMFENTGDCSAALAAYGSDLNEEDSFSQFYNRSLLSYLATGGKDSTFIDNIDTWNSSDRGELKDDSKLERKRKRKQYTMLFNRCLFLFVSSKPAEAAQKIIDAIGPFINEREIMLDDLLNVTARMAFLILDCILSISEGSRGGLSQIDESFTSDAIVSWLESQDLDTDSQLKFLLSLYKSRLDLATRYSVDGKLDDSKLRAVKKELKNAMELFNHKLRTTGETGSLGSLSDVPSNDGSAPYLRERVPNPPARVGSQEGLLQGHHQSALNLKAQLEQLKGNAKKSLILCTEANISQVDPSYERLDANNRSIVYATCCKKHLALHAAAKALLAPKEDALFRSDGTARCDVECSVLANASLSALQGRRYQSAYECMATCVQKSDAHSKRPRGWLRMAEACIGLHTEKLRQKLKMENTRAFSVIEDNGQPKGIMVNVSSDGGSGKMIGSNARPGSQEDLEYVAKFPLQQASFCLDKVMKLLRDASIGALGIEMDHDCLESARCAQAYVMLELKEYKQALFLSKLLLMDGATKKETSGLHHIMHKRRRATASMYGCEACCALGDAVGALKFLTGEKEEDAVIDRLAMDLAGIGTKSYLDVPTTVQSETKDRRKVRIKQAQAMVRTSASAATAAIGRLGTAKQLAVSAISLEESAGAPLCESNRTSPRKALLYCMLREGNNDGALAVLRSSR